MPQGRRQRQKRPVPMAALAYLSVFVVLGFWVPAASAAARPRADLHLVGRRSDAARLQEVLEPLLRQQRIGVQFSVTEDITVKDVLRPPADTEGLIARIFIDLRETQTITLYMSNARAQSFAFREVRVETGKAELAREATGAIVDAALRILLSGGSLELSRAEAEDALQSEGRPGVRESEPARFVAERGGAAPRTATSRTLRPVAFYAVNALAFNGGAIVHGPGVALDVVPESRLHPTFSLQYQLPTTFGGAAVGARITTLASRAGAAWNVAASSGSRLALTLSAGVDAIWLSAKVVDRARVAPSTSRWVAAAMLRPSVQWGYELAGWGFGAMAFLDVDLLGTRYTVRRDQAQLVLFEPWRVRPGLAALVTW